MANSKSKMRYLAIPVLCAFMVLGACSTLSDNAVVRGIGNVLGGDSEKKAKAKTEGRIAVLAGDKSIEIDPTLADIAVNIPEAISLQNWGNAGGILTNAPQNLKGDGQLSISWRKKIGAAPQKTSGLIAAPIISNNVLYTIDANMVLHATSLSNNREIWNARLAQSQRRGFFRGTTFAISGGIGIEGNTLVVSSGFGEVIGINAENGSVLWRVKTEAPVHTAPLVANNRAYVVSNDSQLYAINTNNGEIVWTQNAIAEPARVFASSSSAILGETLVTPFASGEMVASLAANGRKLWSESLTRQESGTSLSAISDIAGRPVIFQGTVYGVSQSGIVSAIDLRSGVILWDKPIGSIQSPWVAGDFLYLVSTDSELYCLDRKEGKVKWIRQLEQFENQKKRKNRVTWTGPIMVDGNLILGSSRGEIVTISALDGKSINSIKTKSPIHIAPIAANGTVYFYSDSAEIIALR